MNEHIKQFERESGLDVYALGLDKVKWESRLDKFAELIVRECMRVADSHGKGWAHLNGTEGNRIRQHFGIAE
jgi:hypothetical protein